MFDDKEFWEMRDFLERENPALLSSKTEVLQKISDFDAEIFELENRRTEEGVAIAIHLLLQARNFLARCLGEPEAAVPEWVERLMGGEEEYHVPPKYVAVYSSQELIARATGNVYGLFSDLRCRIYTSMAEMVKDFLSNRICGVLGIQTERGRFVESNLRHDLKNLPDWGPKRAEMVALPPCADVHLLEVMTGVAIIRQMQEGSYRRPGQADRFSLCDHLPILAARMFIPSRQRFVYVLDDEEPMMKGMETILQSWPNLGVSRHLQSGNGFPDLPTNFDIFLLDEGMGKISGSDVAALIRPPAIAASTSGGGRPSWARWHFGGKDQVAKNLEAASAFVDFVNQLLICLDRQ